MIGFILAITSAGLWPRMARSSSAILRRILWSASRLGRVSAFAPVLGRWRRMLKDRKSNPSSMRTIRVLSVFMDRPRSFNQAPSLALTVSAVSIQGVVDLGGCKLATRRAGCLISAVVGR
jgi:hypothetical protein